MGNIQQFLVCRIGLYDKDLQRLSHHLYSPLDYVGAIADISEFILTRMNQGNKINAKYAGELSYYFKSKEIRRVIICHNQQKMVSYHFPFQTIQIGNSFLLTLNGVDINLEKLAKIKEILEYLRNRPKERWGSQFPPSLIDAYKDLSDDEYDEIPDDIFSLFYHISSTEPGYLRYDYDPTGQNGKIHPLHHFDINYNCHSTYKYGLYDLMKKNSFENIFIRSEEKLYLHSYSNFLSVNNQRKESKKNIHSRKFRKKLKTFRSYK